MLRQGDRVSIPLDAPVANGDRIVIERGKEIVLTADGKTRSVYSCEPVLEQALAECGIVMNPHDEITPAIETPVTEGMTVQVFRVEVIEKTVSEAIERPEIIRPNFDVPASYQTVLDEGWDGACTVTYRVVTRDGQEIIKQELEREILWEPGARIIEKGIQGKKVVASSKAELSVKKELICNATAYDASPASNGIYAGKTATGRKPAYGVVAVDPSVIPLGSRLYIEAVDGSWVYGYAIAGDTGGAIRGKKVDLFYNTAGECRAFGRRQARVYVLD